jgi:hypothetical protein
MRFRITALSALLLLLAAATPTAAQYFGRNKVQYERFDFKVLPTEHFDIYYYPEEEAAVRMAARMAERWYARLSKLLDHELSGRQPLILYAAHPHFQQTNVLAGEIGEGTGGVTESAKRRVILPFAGGLAETDHVLGHELVHAFQYDLAAQTDVQGRPIGPALQALPLWFIEGMAEYLSIGPVDVNTSMWVREASFRNAMPSIDRLDDPDFFPYRYGHAFWAYVAGRWGDRVVGQLLRATGPDGNINAAITAILGVEPETLTAEWHEATRRAYAGIFETTKTPEAFGRTLITREGGGGDMNVSPSLSPDGRRVVFLSERSLFSIDMFVADVATAEITRKIVETTSDPHFDSLQFLSSAGDWAPDNRRFVFAALSRGQPVLSIVDVDRGSREAEHEFADLGEIYNPAWSPDGRQIAFSALKGGVLDLYLFTLEGATLRQLTDDPFADMDPEWSPDGRELIWVTDRFSGDLPTLAFGNYRIAAMAVAGGRPRELAGFDTGNNTNPEFAPDGTLFFIAAPDGIPNVYRLPRGGTASRVTNVVSGVAGITPLTPAMSAASSAPGLVFTVFENDRYNIYASDTTRPATVGALATDARSAAVLPPIDRKPGEVVQLLSTPSGGLPPPPTVEPEDYKPKLGLDAIAQPSVGVGVDQFGAYGGGGIAFLFSDMLGDHMLGASMQVTSRLEETGGSVMYLNRKSRWNWGAVAEQLPYTAGGFSQGITTIDGQQALVQENFRVLQLNQAATGILQYPFSRAQRLELSAGARRISFDSQIERLIFSPFTGQLLDERVEELPRPDALNLGEAAAALVYDTSVFGATSPLIGQRYRVEYSRLAGSLDYSGVLADYRHYFMPVRPFTFAVRGLHYGRYGSGAEDPRLSPLYLGYQGLVRGYDVGSFDANECQELDLLTCDAFDRLNGSRIGILSAELRFPLLGLFNGGRSFYGPFPIELAVFGDAGVAWTSDLSPSFAGGERDFVRSAGLAFRVNLFGYAIAEVDYVKPFDRSRRGWLWQFGLTPGF